MKIALKTFFTQTAPAWLITAIELQLFLMIISLPIVIAWGLPISMMAIAGNIIFGPFLTVFLFTASLLFISEILSIPNGALIYILELINKLWLRLLSYAHKGWLLSYPHTPYWALALIGIAGLYCMKTTYIKNSAQRIVALCVLLALSFVSIHLIFGRSHVAFTIKCGAQELPAIRHAKQTVLVLTPALNRIRSIDSWISYTALPQLAQATGSTTIDHLIIVQPTSHILHGASGLLQKTIIKNIYIPFFKGTLDKQGWHYFYRLQSQAVSAATKLHRIGKNTQAIMLNADNQIRIESEHRFEQKKDFTVAKLKIVTQIDNTQATLYAAE